jgi:hypothetical protein
LSVDEEIHRFSTTEVEENGQSRIEQRVVKAARENIGISFRYWTGKEKVTVVQLKGMATLWTRSDHGISSEGFVEDFDQRRVASNQCFDPGFFRARLEDPKVRSSHECTAYATITRARAMAVGIICSRSYSG